jgi:hypothetical protein
LKVAGIAVGLILAVFSALHFIVEIDLFSAAAWTVGSLVAVTFLVVCIGVAIVSSHME